MTDPFTREDFEREYAKRSNMTVDELRLYFHALKCDCGDELCEGWAMVQLDFTNHRGINGYDEDFHPITIPNTETGNTQP